MFARDVEAMRMPPRVVGTYEDLLKILSLPMQACNVGEVHINVHVTTGRELSPGVTGEVLLVGGLPKFRRWVYRASPHRGPNPMSMAWRLVSSR
jgi:hypothetical protein